MSVAESRDDVRARDPLPTVLDGCAVFARYRDRDGRCREVVALDGAGASVLVIDRAAPTAVDPRLIAHVAADEAPGNAQLICSDYMSAPNAAACRRLGAEDLLFAPPSELESLAAQLLLVDGDASQTPTALCAAAGALSRTNGERFALELRFTGISSPELRWYGQFGGQDASAPLSLRDVIGRLQRYEPARTLTARAVTAHRDAASVSVSVTALAVELERLNASRTVLNRALRSAVLTRVRGGSASMSEIALRCGRVKSDARGRLSGETSWLARRIGVAADAPGCAPTPWVHSDVLALIARDGLGISPREVEVAE
jgi:hypothetical protein